jgi:hypothetical protein
MAAVPGMVAKPLKKGVAANQQLGGTGKDADQGKERTNFEDERRQGNAGGKDRPPVYKPPTDYVGGYQSKTIPAPPKKKIPSLGPGAILKGTSAVHGMIPRY